MATQPPPYSYATYGESTFDLDKSQLVFEETQSEFDDYMVMRSSEHQAGNIIDYDYFRSHPIVDFIYNWPMSSLVPNACHSTTTSVDPILLGTNKTDTKILSMSSEIEPSTPLGEISDYPISSVYGDSKQTASHEDPVDQVPLAQVESTNISPCPLSDPLLNTSTLTECCANPDTVKRKTRGRRKKNPRTAAEIEQRKVKHLERNREAAARCRVKKKKEIEGQVTRSEQDRQKNASLTAERDYLLDMVKTLNTVLLEHLENNLECQVVQQEDLEPINPVICFSP